MIRSEARSNLRLLKHKDLCAPHVSEREVSVHKEPVLESVADMEPDRASVTQDVNAQARQIAMRALASREHSRGELVAKLERRGVDREVAHQVVGQLAEDGMQSEERFAESFVRSRVERGYGPILIRQELRQREVGDDCIDEFLTRDQAFWAARASLAVEKRFKIAPETREAWGRQARYLSRRGFSADLIYACLGDQR